MGSTNRVMEQATSGVEGKTITQAEKNARIERLREQIKILRKNATEGHMPYMIDALELVVDLLEHS